MSIQCNLESESISMKNNVSTEGTENVKKKKKAPLIIIAVALIAIIGACNSNKTEVDSVPDRTTQSSQSSEDSLAEVTDIATEKSSETENISEEETTVADADVSPEIFVDAVKEAIKGAVGSDETITAVGLTDGALTVSVDLSKADVTIASLEDLAVIRSSSITDAILELKQYDELWNNITVDFGEVGSVSRIKDDIKESTFGRYFEIDQLDSQKITDNSVNEENVSVAEVSQEYSNALIKAESYAKNMNMSKAAIYDQLTSEYGEQFPADAAQYAVDNLVADFNANALAKAKNYAENMNMSKAAIYDQLVSEHGEQFAPEEAQYAVDNLVADYNYNALQKAISYQKDMAMSTDSIYDQLVSEYGEKFTPEEAQYAIDNLN